MKLFQAFRKEIALIALFSFLSLIHLSAALPPVSTTPTSNETHAKPASDDGSGPGLIEQNAPQYQRQKKSSPILPIVIGVVLVGAVVAVLVLVVFKTKYDPIGNWSVTVVIGGNYYDWTDTFTFTGSKTKGSFTTLKGGMGTYAVDGKKIHFEITNLDWRFTGEFSSKTAMSGTMNGTAYDSDTDEDVPLVNRPWNAVRGSAPVSLPAIPGSLQKVKKSVK